MEPFRSYLFTPNVVSYLDKYGVSNVTVSVATLKEIYVNLDKQFKQLRERIEIINSLRGADNSLSPVQRVSLRDAETQQSEVGEVHSALMAALMEARVPMQELDI